MDLQNILAFIGLGQNLIEVLSPVWNAVQGLWNLHQIYRG